MATFVLVHGGFQGGWSFKALARQLREAGHEVYVATLTGLGERCHLIGLPINLDLPPFLRQPVKAQNPRNGELSHGIDA